ncbi:unnamed protein product [Candidula unifasciata]|uniref:N-acetyltransferase domain-containing protein n=1 Tax=Candidula unifasciata TaxID=100452 RepID=A0A8S3ZD82_9EUPU|nr:unnamed protein product [Candidula unifasciata]
MLQLQPDALYNNCSQRTHQLRSNNHQIIADSKENVHIRPWQAEDYDGVWSVLKDASYSNINPTFIVILQKPFLWAVNMILLSVGFARELSVIFLVVCFLGELCLIYAMSVLGAIIYLYGQTLSDIKDIKTSYFTTPDHHFWVAVCQGEIAGTVAVVRKVPQLHGAPCKKDPTSEDCSRGKIAWLRRMAVSKRFRGLGVAKQLVKTSLEFCQSRNYESVFLITTEVHHAARSLYSNMGFQLIACKPYRYLKGLLTIKTFEFEMVLR